MPRLSGSGTQTCTFTSSSSQPGVLEATATVVRSRVRCGDSRSGPFTVVGVRCKLRDNGKETSSSVKLRSKGWILGRRKLLRLTWVDASLGPKSLTKGSGGREVEASPAGSCSTSRTIEGRPKRWRFCRATSCCETKPAPLRRN
eukprot:Skav226422  [mRNA]  locus=scaffold872:16320:34442:- [translate_table: standard]